MATTIPARPFVGFPKLARLHRAITITEKIDGTNACVVITEDDEIHAQSRNRIITPDSDNHGFARWVHENQDDLYALGVGHHFGEWYGAGIQRRYGLDHKRFALFNTGRWGDPEVRPACCHVVPVLCESTADRLNAEVHTALSMLRDAGSAAAPGFMNPEGIVIYHHAARISFKVTLENDETPKSLVA